MVRLGQMTAKKGKNKMSKRDDGKSVIDINCFCSDKKDCRGNLYIQPDTVNNTKVFMVEVMGSNGDEDAYMWLSISQLEQLKEELSVLIDEFEK
jgi:hypothetical protein